MRISLIIYTCLFVGIDTLDSLLVHHSLFMDSLIQACRDILNKNMEYNPDTQQKIYFLYDTESPLAKILSDAWIEALPE